VCECVSCVRRKQNRGLRQAGGCLADSHQPTAFVASRDKTHLDRCTPSVKQQHVRLEVVHCGGLGILHGQCHALSNPHMVHLIKGRGRGRGGEGQGRWGHNRLRMPTPPPLLLMADTTKTPTPTSKTVTATQDNDSMAHGSSRCVWTLETAATAAAHTTTTHPLPALQAKGEGGLLPRHNMGHGGVLAVDRLDNDGDKRAQPVRPKQQFGVAMDDAPEGGGANTQKSVCA
jgi:hypothetical protein